MIWLPGYPKIRPQDEIQLCISLQKFGRICGGRWTWVDGSWHSLDRWWPLRCNSWSHRWSQERDHPQKNCRTKVAGDRQNGRRPSAQDKNTLKNIYIYTYIWNIYENNWMICWWIFHLFLEQVVFFISGFSVYLVIHRLLHRPRKTGRPLKPQEFLRGLWEGSGDLPRRWRCALENLWRISGASPFGFLRVKQTCFSWDTYGKCMGYLWNSYLGCGKSYLEMVDN